MTVPPTRHSAQASPPEIGDALPLFQLADHLERPTALSRQLRGKAALILFMPSAWAPAAQPVLRGFAQAFDRLDPLAHIFAITAQPVTENAAAVAQLSLPFPLLADTDGMIARAYGVSHNDPEAQAMMGAAAFTAVLGDANGRVLRIDRDSADGGLAQEIASCLEAAAEAPREMRGVAPVLFVPRAFEPDFCDTLIEAFESGAKRRSGTLRDLPDGRRVHYVDDSEKVRSDHRLEGALHEEAQSRVAKRVLPEIYKAFGFQVTRSDNFKIGCYEGGSGGHFRVHRDNDTPSGLHRRFAMTLNLNTGAYEGGFLRFPEYGPHLYRPEKGEAAVFSCSLLHEATPVSAGTRYVLLSFLFGEAEQRLLERRGQAIEQRRAAGQTG